MIDYIVNFDISIMSLILLSILLVVARFKRDQFSFSSQLLKVLIIITIIGAILEPLSWFVEGKPGNVYYQLGFITNSFVLLMGTLLSAIWISYWDYKIVISKKRIVQRKYYLYPVLAQFILMVFNRITKIFFEIDVQTNMFIAKPLYFVLYLIYLMYFMYLFFMIIKYRKKANPKVLRVSLIFMGFPALSALVQLLVPQFIISWPSLTISILLTYLFLETTTGHIDDLTKLYSRSLLELHLRSLVEDKKPFYAIMLDLDHFKDVNDVFGHLMGDQVLVHFANILRKCITDNNTFISRLGGDEFFIIYRGSEEDLPQDLINHIKDQMIKNEFIQKFPFLDFSVGSIYFNDKMTIDDVFNLTDKKMYEQKYQRHLMHQEQKNKNI